MKYTIVIIFLQFFVSTSAQVKEKQTYPLVVEFVSECCGVPDKKPIIDFIKSFNKKYNKKSITINIIGPTGREGEYYMAFSLKEFKKKEAKMFIEQIQKVTKKPNDKGNIIYEKNLTVDKSEFKRSKFYKEEVIKI